MVEIWDDFCGKDLRKRRERMKRFFEKNKEKILNFELDGLDFSD